MAEFTLVIGNKNYSSWSMRPWIVMKHIGIEFEEVLIPLYRPQSKAEILKHSPSGKVPTLIHRGAAIWDSLAICEYLAESFPNAHLWPQDRAARARARSISAEMHSGFQNLRQTMGMDLRASHPDHKPTPEAAADIERIVAIWNGCREEFGAGGEFLFGSFTIADAMYAPVVTRFTTYGVKLDPVCDRYSRTIWALPATREWRDAGIREPWTIEF